MGIARPFTLVILAAVVALAAITGAWQLARPAPMPAPPVPADLADLPPLFASRLNRALQDARDHPRDADRRLGLARLYHAHGRRSAAGRCYEQVVASRPDDPVAWHLLGLVRQRLADNAGAAAALERAAALAPGRAETRWQLGFLALEAGNADHAASRFDEALKLDPQSEPARFGLARSLLMLGRTDEALALIETHMLGGAHPEYAEHLLGTAYRQLGRLEEARPLLERPVPPSPRWSDPWLDETLAMRRVDATVTVGDEDRARAADAYLEQGQYAQALPILMQLSAETPGDVELLNKIAITRIESGDRRGGLEMLRVAAGIDPDDAATHTNLARAHLEAAREDPDASAKALAAADRSLALRPESPRTHRLRGHALTVLARHVEAVDAFQEAFRLDGRDPAPLVEAARLQIALREFVGAAESLRTADDVHPLEGESLLMLALAELQCGRPGRAQLAVDRLRRRGGVETQRIDVLQAAIERAGGGGGAP